jgi:hypothetical protein
MSDEEWYITNGEWRMGPLTADDAVEVLGRDHAPGSVLVWKEGLETWTRPELVAELTAAAAGRPPVRPAAPPSATTAAPATGATADGPPAPWFRVGTSKFLLMCVATFGLYEIYWFYQQWRHVQQRGESVHPALRTLFAGFFCYALFRRVADDAAARGVSGAPSALGCAVAFVLLSVTSQLPAPWSSLSLLSLLPLAIVQRTASAAALAAEPSADPNVNLTPINWIGVGVGVLLLVLTVMRAAVVPVPPPATPAAPAPSAVTTQARLTAPAIDTSQASVN